MRRLGLLVGLASMLLSLFLIPGFVMQGRQVMLLGRFQVVLRGLQVVRRRRVLRWHSALLLVLATVRVSLRDE